MLWAYTHTPSHPQARTITALYIYITLQLTRSRMCTHLSPRFLRTVWLKMCVNILKFTFV
jgi:hypothetical protein